MESQLNHAVSDKDAEEVRRLVREGADVNSPALRRQWRPAFGDAPLEAAVAMGESNMVRLLVELGADAESGGRNSPVWTVLTKGDTKMLDVMRDADVSLPLEALFFACKQGDKELAAWLIDNGWDVNARLGEKGRTDLERDGAPLHVAVGAGHRNIVELLLAHGADVNDVGEDRKRTPLMIAAQKPDVDMLEFLLAAGADPGIQAKNGWSAMHYAAFRGSVGTLKNLFSRAPELVDVRTRSGETPLWLACIAYSRSNLESIRFLLEHGADRGVANHRGESISEALRKDVKIVSGRGDTESVDRIHATIDLLESSD